MMRKHTTFFKGQTVSEALHHFGFKERCAGAPGLPFLPKLLFFFFPATHLRQEIKFCSDWWNWIFREI